MGKKAFSGPLGTLRILIKKEKYHRKFSGDDYVEELESTRINKRRRPTYKNPLPHYSSFTNQALLKSELVQAKSEIKDGNGRKLHSVKQRAMSKLSSKEILRGLIN